MAGDGIGEASESGARSCEVAFRVDFAFPRFLGALGRVSIIVSRLKMDGPNSRSLAFSCFAVIGATRLGLAPKGWSNSTSALLAGKVLTLKTRATSIPCGKWLNQLAVLAAFGTRRN